MLSAAFLGSFSDSLLLHRSNIDIGGGTTDIAVISMGDIVTASSIKMAGDKFDLEILNYIKREYKLLIGERTAEDIKIKVATVFPDARHEEISIRGRDMVTGLPRTITVTSKDPYRLPHNPSDFQQREQALSALRQEAGQDVLTSFLPKS